MNKNLSIDNLWSEFLISKDKNVRSKLIMNYVPLIKFVVDRLVLSVTTVLSRDDLISIGITGLISAIEKFDINKGVKFETYAITRIKGSVIDELRKLDWVPRTRRKKLNKTQEAYQRLESELGRAATDEEVAEYVGCTVAELSNILENAETFSILSLDQAIPFFDDGSKIKLVDMCEDKKNDQPADLLEKKELIKILTQGIINLPKQERLVVSLYYYDNLTLKEISEVLKLSTSRISQIHTKAVMRLRGRLANFLKPMIVEAQK
jgi:RNA polymerase sigma factor for flagellar operon FliA